MGEVRRVLEVGGGGRPRLPLDERLVRFYHSTLDYERDVAHLAEAGWRVVKVVTPPHWSWRHLLAFGFPAAAQRQPELLVTYARAQSDQAGKAGSARPEAKDTRRRLPPPAAPRA